MLRPLVKRIAATWLAGLLVLLPAVLTVAVLGWVVDFIVGFVGPGTLVGRLFAALGYRFTERDELAYLFGTLVLLVAIYGLGLLVQRGLSLPWAELIRGWLQRVPLVGDLYGMAERLVSVLKRSDRPDMAAMRPVWCVFGGSGAAVLALAPSPEPLLIDGRPHVGVLIPTAPVPVGGALLYVPAHWVRPADIGMDKLTAIYVSMGITPPPSPAGQLQQPDKAVPPQ
jgi:uncharacterized membrane protein